MIQEICFAELEWVEVKTHLEFEKKNRVSVRVRVEIVANLKHMKLKTDNEDHNFFDFV